MGSVRAGAGDRPGIAVGAADGLLPVVQRTGGQNATAFVHGYLKELILDLVVQPKTLITEMDVARATGLSRTPIREAFLRLHEERLVEIFPRRGALVSPITARQIRELYEVRFLLEFHAAEVICTERLSAADTLTPLCTEQATLYAEGALPPALIRVDRQFHSELIAAAGNTVMSTVNDSLGDHHQRTGVLSFSLDRRRCEMAVEQHLEITAALAGFDLKRARRAIERHLVIGQRELEKLLRN